MGDLKKKTLKDDIMNVHMADADKINKIIKEQGKAYDEEQIIERLREYIKKFYEIQEKKLELEEQAKKKEGE